MSIQRKQERLDALLERPDNDPDAVEAVWDALDAISRDRAYLDNEDGFRRHLMHYLSQHSGPAACGCRAPNCPLHAGRLPDALADTTRPLPTAIEMWASQHSGTPHVLIQATESWASRESRVERTLSECATALLNDDPDAISVLDDTDEQPVSAGTAGGEV